MQTVESAEALFDQRLNELLDDLDPATPLELYFSSKIARFSVLLENAQKKMIVADISDLGPKSPYRQLHNEVIRYQRAFDTAYNELRRLQTIRASQTPAAPKPEEIAAAPLLARTMFLTSRTGIRKTPGVESQTLERQSRQAQIETQEFRQTA